MIATRGISHRARPAAMGGPSLGSPRTRSKQAGLSTLASKPIFPQNIAGAKLPISRQLPTQSKDYRRGRRVRRANRQPVRELQSDRQHFDNFEA